MRLLELLAGVPLFEGLGESQYQGLAAIVRSRSYEKGETIFSEGDEGAGLYLVGEGRVKIFKLSPDGKEQILHIFGAGEPFGEVAVFAGRRFPAYAEALDKSEILFLPRPDFIELIRKNPDLALSIIGVMSMRLRRFANLIEDLSLKEVPGRLAAYLLILDQRQGGGGSAELDVTKTQLASLLGTIPETLSRILKKMSQQELIRLEGRTVVLLNPDGLRDLAEAETRL